MAYFRYQAATATGESTGGVVEAADEQALYAQLRTQDLFLLSARPEGRRHHLDHRIALSRGERLEVTHHLATVLGAGIGLLTALEDLVAHAAPRQRSMFTTIVEQVRGGGDLSVALALFPLAFPDTYVQVVAAGEATGGLGERFADLALDLEYQIELRRQVRKAVAYPLTLVVAVAALVVLVFTFVVPQFAPIFEQAGVNLPLPTRVVVGVSHFMQGQWPVIVGAVVVGVGGGMVARALPGGRRLLDRLLLALPWIGALRAELAVAADGGARPAWGPATPRSPLARPTVDRCPARRAGGGRHRPPPWPPLHRRGGAAEGARSHRRGGGVAHLPGGPAGGARARGAG